MSILPSNREFRNRWKTGSTLCDGSPSFSQMSASRESVDGGGFLDPDFILLVPSKIHLGSRLTILYKFYRSDKISLEYFSPIINASFERRIFIIEIFIGEFSFWKIERKYKWRNGSKDRFARSVSSDGWSSALQFLIQSVRRMTGEWYMRTTLVSNAVYRWTTTGLRASPSRWLLALVHSHDGTMDI